MPSSKTVVDPSEEEHESRRVDICAAIVATKPPVLPLREELNSLGFEVVLAPAGTGVKAAKYQSRKNVEKYRRYTAFRDLKKRRVFPKSNKRIRQKLDERKRIEHELELPHALSYETYEVKMQYSESSSSGGSYSSDSRSRDSRKNRAWGMFKRRHHRQKVKPSATTQSDPLQHPAAATQSGKSDFSNIASQAMFPDIDAETQRERESWRKAFGGWVDENGQEPGPEETRQQHNLGESRIVDGVPDTFGAFDGLEAVFSGTTGDIFDGLDSADSKSKRTKESSAGGAAASSINDATSASAITGPVPPENRPHPEFYLVTPQSSKLDPDGVSFDFGASRKETEEGDRVESPSELFQRVSAEMEEEKKEDDASTVPTRGPSFDEALALSISGEEDEEETLAMKIAKSGSSEGKESYATASTLALMLAKTNTRGEDKDSAATMKLSPRNETHTAQLPTIGEDEQGQVDEPPRRSPLPWSSSEPVSPASSLDAAAAQAASSFDKATAEIMSAVGISVQVGEEEDEDGPDSPTSQLSPSSWMSSAKHVFDNLSSGVIKVTGLEKNRGKKPSSLASPKAEGAEAQGPATSPTATVDLDSFFSLLSRFDATTSEIENILASNPELPLACHEEDGRLPLHSLCNRGMPDRSSVPVERLTTFLLGDIASYKNHIKLLHFFNPDACLSMDKNGDLPLHLVARRFMEWEATWYEIVYQEAAKEKDCTEPTTIAITMLYQAMTEVIEMLIQPIINSSDQCESLCREPGSMGTILPLHVAAIFTVSVNSLRRVLEANPDAARTNCDLGILRTFVPDECLPLELHDNLSTDFPKWELTENEGDQSTSSPLGKRNQSIISEDSMRRSDLLFAYHPIEPHRFEKARIRRLESQIQYDATILTAKDPKRLFKANERLWVWMCTFREPDTGRPTYRNSVKRIISALSIPSLEYLASIETDEGKILFDAANPECSRVIKKRMQRLLGPSIPPVKEENVKSSEWQPEKEFVGHLCRLVFNVPETPFPTSFVILPYELKKETSGALRLASLESSVVATLFAECLMNLTYPETILSTLDSKSIEHFGRSLFKFAPDDALNLEMLARVGGYEKSLVSLFEFGDGYLYLIDESTGLPRITDDDDAYPIVLRNPADLVEELLPLMLMGMVQMRGEKAIPKLASVILSEDVAMVMPSWIEASDRLIAYLELQRSGELDGHVDVPGTLASLRALHSSGASKQAALRSKKERSEWNAELLVLKMLFEVNDPDCQFSGLSVAARNKSPHFTADRAASPERVPAEVQGNTDVPEQESRVDDVSMSTVSGPAVLEISRRFDQSYTANNDSSLENVGMVDVTELSHVLESDSSPNISELWRKMEELSQLQHSLSKDAWRTSSTGIPQPPSNVASTESNDDLRSDRSDFSRQRKQLLSKYSMLFEELGIDGGKQKDVPELDIEDDVLIWNDVDEVWEEVVVSRQVWDDAVHRVEWQLKDMEWQLNTRAEHLRDDPQVLQLKVALAEQAQKLADLGKKVSNLKEEEKRFVTHKGGEVYDLTEIEDDDPSSRENARKLVIRMCDLEDRLVYDAINIQHLSMEAIRVEDEGAEMMTGTPANTPRTGLPSLPFRPRDPLPRELSGISWKINGSGEFHSSDSDVSFIRYEKAPSATKVVRFEGIPEKYASPALYDTSSSIGDGARTDLSTATLPSRKEHPPSISLPHQTVDSSARSDPDGYSGREISTESSYYSSLEKSTASNTRDLTNKIPSDEAIVDGENYQEPHQSTRTESNPAPPAYVEAFHFSEGHAFERGDAPMEAMERSRSDDLLVETVSTGTGGDSSANQHMENFPPVAVIATPKDPEEILPMYFTFDPNKPTTSQIRADAANDTRETWFRYQDEPVGSRIGFDLNEAEMLEDVESTGEREIFERVNQVLLSPRLSGSIYGSTTVSSVFRPTRTISFNRQSPNRDLSALTQSGDHSDSLVELAAPYEYGEI